MKIDLYNENCYDLMKRIPDGSIDFIVTDPPYGSTNLEWDKEQDYENLFAEWFRIAKENAAIIVFSQQPYATDIINACRKYFRYETIWEKTMKMGFPNANKMPLKAHENMLVFYKKLPTYNPQKYIVGKDKMSWGRQRKQGENRYDGYTSSMGKSIYTDDGTRMSKSVIQISNWNGALFGKTDKAVVHPTQKPVDLFRYLILTYSNEGETVFDGFAGSGTAAVACLEESRNFIGSELNEEYYKGAINRIENERLQTKLF